MAGYYFYLLDGIRLPGTGSRIDAVAAGVAGRQCLPGFKRRRACPRRFDQVVHTVSPTLEDPLVVFAG